MGGPLLLPQPSQELSWWGCHDGPPLRPMREAMGDSCNEDSYLRAHQSCASLVGTREGQAERDARGRRR